MAVSDEDVKRIAKLARLRLAPEEVSLYREQFSRILGLMAELSRLGTEGVPATASVLEVSNVMREDRPASFAGVEKLLANAPGRQGDFYRTPKVIE